MPNPFGFVPQDSIATVWVIAFMASLVCMGVISRIGPSRLAGRIEQTHNQYELDSVVSGFGLSGRSQARMNLTVDFAFIPTYVLAIGLVCSSAASAFHSEFWKQFALSIGWITYIVGLADVVENVLLWSLLTTGFNSTSIAIAKIATQTKISTLAISLCFALPSLAILILSRLLK